MKRLIAIVAGLMLAGSVFAVTPTAIDNSGTGNVADGNVVGNNNTSTSTSTSTTTNNGVGSGAGSVIQGGAGGAGGKGGSSDATSVAFGGDSSSTVKNSGNSSSDSTVKNSGNSESIAKGGNAKGGNATGGTGIGGNAMGGTGGKSVSSAQGGKGGSSEASASNNVNSSGNGAGQEVNIKSPRLAATAIAGYGETTANCRFHDGAGLQLLIVGVSVGKSRKDADCARLELVKYFCDHNAQEAAQDVACKISFVKDALGDHCQELLETMCLVEVPIVAPVDFVTHSELHEVERRSLEKKLSK